MFGRRRQRANDNNIIKKKNPRKNFEKIRIYFKSADTLDVRGRYKTGFNILIIIGDIFNGQYSRGNKINSCLSTEYG